MKIFEITLGSNKNLIVAKNKEEAFEKRAEVDPSYDYLPVEVNELKIDGYDIVVEKEKPKKEEKEEVKQAENTENQTEVETPKEDKPKQDKNKAKNKKSNK